MAELLIKAREPWNNDADTTKMTPDELQRFKARSRRGDIVVVKPDGWEWGREECLPRFVIVKVPGASVEEFEEYLRPVMEDRILGDGSTEQVLIAYRGLSISKPVVDACAEQPRGIQKVSKAEILAALRPRTAK